MLMTNFWQIDCRSMYFFAGGLSRFVYNNIMIEGSIHIDRLKTSLSTFVLNMLLRQNYLWLWVKIDWLLYKWCKHVFAFSNFFMWYRDWGGIKWNWVLWPSLDVSLISRQSVQGWWRKLESPEKKYTDLCKTNWQTFSHLDLSLVVFETTVGDERAMWFLSTL